ncbi:hypothetical protein EDD17DRAFT_962545 [Pisolithus thermaeus]|nr:hypothetical protein EV401DRAFT_1065098 [Pisolithus croceorrhizus]KAI6167563.1 hypothetical protein EDD17DRAFT_962545 [Pisolithus thermaeus]
MGVTQTPVKNDPFEKVSCSSQEEHIFAFCHPEGVDNSSSLAADVSTPSPALSRNCENHTDGNNTSMPSFRSMRTSEPHLPMPTRSPYVVSDCVVSNRSYSRVALLHATSSSPSCDSEQSTTVKRMGVMQDVSQDAQSTPGPTHYCCQPYLDSTTEDGLSCDTTEDGSLLFDIHSIDFRWKPFPRSKVSNGDPARQRESDSSQQVSLHFPVSRALPPGDLDLRRPVYTDTSPTPSPLARRGNVRRVCCSPASDGPRNLPRDQFPYLSDEESRVPSPQCAFPDEHLAVMTEPCKSITVRPSGHSAMQGRTGIDIRARCSHPRGERKSTTRCVVWPLLEASLPKFH